MPLPVFGHEFLNLVRMGCIVTVILVTVRFSGLAMQAAMRNGPVTVRIRRLQGIQPVIVLSDIEVFDPAGYREGEDMGLTDIFTIPWGVYDARPIPLEERLDHIARFGDEVIAKM